VASQWFSLDGRLGEVESERVSRVETVRAC
jgi:hypothetical protein